MLHEEIAVPPSQIPSPLIQPPGHVSSVKKVLGKSGNERGYGGMHAPLD